MTSVAETLLQGAVIGLAIAAPVGPIGLLCVRRTLAEGPASGLASGLGAAAADAAYGLVAVLGLGVVAAVLTRHAAWLQLAGGALLVWLAVASLRRAMAPAVVKGAEARGSGMLGAFVGTFALTLANPMTILSFAGIVAAFAAGGGAGPGLLLVLGVFAGSTAWWLTLVGGVTLARSALPPGALRLIEAVSGAALLAFGLYAMAEGLAGLTP
jgi:threonine/homoserine/homoserine lactone efflux protein